MKVIKGEAGYIKAKKKQEIIKAVIQFGLILAIFITGYVTTDTRLNWFTVLAVLGCLPAARTLVGVIMLIPRRSAAAEFVSEVEARAGQLVKSYDMVITSYDNVMPIDSMVIFENIVCGYSSNKKIEPAIAASYIKKTLHNNGYDKVSVKIFTDVKSYLARIEGMENMAEAEKTETRKHEEGIKNVILSLSM